MRKRMRLCVFATKVVRERGHVSDADIKAVRDAGFRDGQIVEIIAVIAENIFTNLLNVVAETDIDFPVVHAAECRLTRRAAGGNPQPPACLSHAKERRHVLRIP